MDKDKLIEKLESRIKLIDSFQKNAKNASNLGRDMPLTFHGGNGRKEELRYVIDQIKSM